jgi:hypothetical protein
MQFEYFFNLLSAFDIFVLSGIRPLNGGMGDDVLHKTGIMVTLKKELL